MTTVTELEVLFTANTGQVDQAAKKVRDQAEKIEKKPVKATITANPADALAGIGRVEATAKKLVSADTIMQVDANIKRAEADFDRTEKRLAYLRSVETELNVDADIKRAEAQLVRAEKRLDALGSARANMELDVDPADALAGMDRVESEAKRLVSHAVAVEVDAKLDRAEKNLTRIQAEVETLRAASPNVTLDADVARAETKLERAEAELRKLQGARATMEIDADTSPAGDALGDVPGIAGNAGDDAGAEFGTSIIAALGTIPIAGAVIGIGAAAAKALVGAFQDGLAQEKGRDRLQALTGIDEPATRRLASAAAEAYSRGFGESIEQNMSAVQAGVQFDLIDADASTRASSKVVEGLAGIADVLNEDVQPVARTVTTMLRAGIVDSADAAFDVLATGAREGVNVAEDLLDTFDEYSPLFARLGLQGPEALGLMSQALDGGARDADKAADALKEFQIRATDGSKASADGFKLLGLDAKEMTEQIAGGGDDARDGLEKVLTELGKMEAGADRTAAATALFGTQAEDLGDALFAMDLSSAVSELDGVNGAARKMFDTLASNDASKVEQALRNIEVAGDGVKGALAAAFAEPLGDFADWVSSNRGPLLEFFAGLVNGAIDFAQTANTAVGDFVSGPMAEMLTGFVAVVDILNGPFVGAPKHLSKLAEGMRGFDDTTDGANQKLEQMRGEFNEFADAQVALGYVHDAAMRTADAVGEVGLNADGTALDLDKLDGSNLKASKSGRKLEEQVKAAIGALDDEIAAADAAGESQGDLEGRYKSTTGALSDQLQEMGLTKKQAKALIDTYAETPSKKATQISAPGLDSTSTTMGEFRRTVEGLPTSKTVTVKVNGMADGLKLLRGAATGGHGADLAAMWGADRLNSGGQPGRYRGLVHGPGSPTSDDVAAWISRREFVTQAEAVDYYGTGVMYAMNSRRIPKALFSALGLAKGGSPGNGISGPSKALTSTLASLQVGTLPVPQILAFEAALKKATTSADKNATSATRTATALEAASEELTAAEKALAKAEKGPKSLQRAEKELAAAQRAVDPKSALGKATTTLRALESSSTKGMSKKQKAKRKKKIDDTQARVNRLEDKRNRRIDAARDVLDWEKEKNAKSVAAAENRVEKAKKDEAKAAEKNAKAQAKKTTADEKAKKASDDLTAAHKALADAARSASEAFVSKWIGAGEGLAGSVASMTEGISGGEDLIAAVETLRKLGLSEDYIQQVVVPQGEVWGVALAKEIEKGGKPTVVLLNDLVEKLDKVGEKLGVVTAVGVEKHADGGRVIGAGSATSDSVLMAASNGEYVLRTASAQALGYDTLDRVNATGRWPSAATSVVHHHTYNIRAELPGVRDMAAVVDFARSVPVAMYRLGARRG